MVLISFLLFFTLSLNSSQLFAQAHPGYEKFNFSKIDEAEALFVRKRYEESLEKFKGILKSEEGTSYIFRIMLKAWNAKGELDNAEKFLKNYQASNKDSSHIWYNSLENDTLVAKKQLTKYFTISAVSDLVTTIGILGNGFLNIVFIFLASSQLIAGSPPTIILF